MKLRCPDCHCTGPFSAVQNGKITCPLCARVFAEPVSADSLPYVERKRNAVDLMHRGARPRVHSQVEDVSVAGLELVVDSLASIIVAGSSFDPDKTDKRQAIADVLEAAERAEAAEAVEPAESGEPVSESVDVEKIEVPNRISQLEAERREAGLLVDEERSAAESFVANRPRFEDERARVEELTWHITQDRAEAEKLRQQRLDAEKEAAEQYAAAKAESERLAAEHLEVSSLLERERESVRVDTEAQQQRQQQLQSDTAELQTQIESDRLAAENLQQQRLKAEQAVAQQREAAQAESQRLAAEQLEVAAFLERERQQVGVEDETESLRRQELQKATEELQTQIANDRVEVQKLEQQRLKAQQQAAEKCAEAEAEVEQLRAERLELTAALEREQTQIRDAAQQQSQRREQLAGSIKQLRQELSTHQEKLQSLQAVAAEASESPEDALEVEQQELLDQRAAVLRALNEQRQIAETREAKIAEIAPKRKKLDELQNVTAVGIAELKKLRRANNKPLPTMPELGQEIAKLEARRAKLDKHLENARRKVSEREERRKVSAAQAESQQAEVERLKSEVTAARTEYKELIARHEAIKEEVKTLTSTDDLAELRSEQAAVQQQLEKAKGLLAEQQRLLKSASKSNDKRRRESTLVGRQIRANLTETREVLERVLEDQAAVSDSGDQPTQKTAGSAVPQTLSFGSTRPNINAVRFPVIEATAVSPVRKSILEPFEDEDDDAESLVGDDPYCEPIPPKAPASTNGKRQPGSLQIMLMSGGLAMIALAMVSSIGVGGMWLFAGYENGTAISDAFTKVLPIVRVAIPAVWGIGALLCLAIPRVARARGDALTALASVAAMFGVALRWWDAPTAAVWATVCVSGLLYGYLLQSFMAELCAFGGFHTCEKQAEKLMGGSTLVALVAASLGIAVWVRAEPAIILMLTRATVLASALLCFGIVWVIGRILTNVAAEQSRGREWLLEQV